MALDANSRHSARGAVAASGIHVSAHRSVAEQDRQYDRAYCEVEHWRLQPAQRPAAEDQERIRIAGEYHAIVGDPERETDKKTRRADRGDQRGNLELGDEDAVKQADQNAASKHDENYQAEWPIGLSIEYSAERASEGRSRTDGEIEFADHEDDRQARRSKSRERRRC